MSDVMNDGNKIRKEARSSRPAVSQGESNASGFSCTRTKGTISARIIDNAKEDWKVRANEQARVGVGV